MLVEWYRRILMKVDQADWCQFDIATSLRSDVDLRVLDGPGSDEDDSSDEENKPNEEKTEKSV